MLDTWDNFTNQVRQHVHTILNQVNSYFDHVDVIRKDTIFPLHHVHIQSTVETEFYHTWYWVLK